MYFLQRKTSSLILWLLAAIVLGAAVLPSAIKLTTKVSPTAGLWVELCTSHGVKYERSPVAPTELPSNPQAIHLERCPLCVLQADSPVILGHFFVWSVLIGQVKAPYIYTYFQKPESSFWITAAPRAPPCYHVEDLVKVI